MGSSPTLTLASPLGDVGQWGPRDGRTASMPLGSGIYSLFLLFQGIAYPLPKGEEDREEGGINNSRNYLPFFITLPPIPWGE